MNCRNCAAQLTQTFLDLGYAPPSNAYLTKLDLCKPERYIPLRIKVCDQCWLVQTEDFATEHELFNSEYAYFSSTSSTWLEHAASYAETMIKGLSLDKNSMVIEIASNDGYLLKNFVKAGIPNLGIEPTKSTADAAEKNGISVLREFFSLSLGKRLANQEVMADLIIGNNVYAHVPNINDFTLGLKAVLKPKGVITLEFPHLMRLIECTQFDTVYHEHYSYLSLIVVRRIFEKSGLRIWRVEKLPTHGGSLRIYGCHADNVDLGIDDSVAKIEQEEINQGLFDIQTYQNFQSRAFHIKISLLSFLIQSKKDCKKVVAYGAAAKGNTLLNYAGIKQDLLPFVCDAAISKQFKYMPGSHIPIYPPQKMAEECPDYVLILPWNISDEVKRELSGQLSPTTKFMVAIPDLIVL